MVRRRIPVLVGTIALLAGCGSSSRVEVSGVVRDRDSGRVIRGALVVAADGSSTRTDDEGRFVLSVLRAEHRSIRASAAEHHDAIEFFDSDQSFDAAERLEGRFEGPASLDLALAPTSAEVVLGGSRIEDDDPDAVLRWLRESWLEDSWSADAARSLSDGAFAGSDDAAVARGHVAAHDGDEGASCASCHGAEAALVAMPLEAISFEAMSLDQRSVAMDAALTASLVARRVDAPHAGLAEGCLACHGRRAADGVRMRASLESDLDATGCASCHGASTDAERALRDELSAAEEAFRQALGRVQRCGRVAADVARIDGALILVDTAGLPVGDCDASGAIDGTELAVGIEVLGPTLGRAALELEGLRRDPSHGAHQPALTRTLRRLPAGVSLHALAP
jgi:hypothetical protein